MRFVFIFLILLMLSACSEHTDKELMKPKSCKYFAQHSRELPIVNSAIPIFENQEFDGVLELTEDSVRFIVSEDTSLTYPPKILVFIDQEKIAPYREIISQALQDKGYWIYYACYDSLGKECFLPEFYDIDRNQLPILSIKNYDMELNLIQTENNEIQIDYDLFLDSFESDSAKFLLKEIIQNRFMSKKYELSENDTLNNNFIWQNRPIAKKIWESNSNISIITNTIKHSILTSIREEDYLSEHLSFSDIEYLTNYQENMKVASLVHQVSLEIFNDFLSSNASFKNNLNHFTEEELQHLPSQIFLSIVYNYNVNSIWFIRSPIPPPTMVKKIPTPPPPRSGKIGCRSVPKTFQQKETTEVIWPKIEIGEENEVEAPIKIDIN